MLILQYLIILFLKHCRTVHQAVESFQEFVLSGEVTSSYCEYTQVHCEF